MLRPSIVFVNRVYPPVPGATGRLLRDLARGFADKGWDVRVITSGPHRHTGNDDAVRVMRLGGPAKPRATGYALSWMRFLIGLPWFSSCDIIVTMTDPPFLGSAGHIFKTLKRARHIHWCQDLYPDLLPTLGEGFRRPR